MRTHQRSHQQHPFWVRADWHRGFYAGFRLRDGAVHFGVRFIRDTNIQYANKRHVQYGISFWLRRNRKGLRGYPHTLTFKVVVA